MSMVDPSRKSSSNPQGGSRASRKLRWVTAIVAPVVTVGVMFAAVDQFANAAPSASSSSAAATSSAVKYPDNVVTGTSKDGAYFEFFVSKSAPSDVDIHYGPEKGSTYGSLTSVQPGDSSGELTDNYCSVSGTIYFFAKYSKNQDDAGSGSVKDPFCDQTTAAPSTTKSTAPSSTKSTAPSTSKSVAPSSTKSRAPSTTKSTAPSTSASSPSSCVKLTDSNVGSYGSFVWTGSSATVTLKKIAGGYCNTFPFDVTLYAPADYPQTVKQVSVAVVGKTKLSATASVSATDCDQIDAYEGRGPAVGSKLYGAGKNYESNHKFLSQIFGGPNSWSSTTSGCNKTTAPVTLPPSKTIPPATKSTTPPVTTASVGPPTSTTKSSTTSIPAPTSGSTTVTTTTTTQTATSTDTPDLAVYAPTDTQTAQASPWLLVGAFLFACIAAFSVFSRRKRVSGTHG